jgi:zinc transport system ATP-binding protein
MIAKIQTYALVILCGALLYFYYDNSSLKKELNVTIKDKEILSENVKNQEQFYLLLRKLNQELHITLILISHDIDVIAGEVTEFACINQTVVYYGEPKKFFMDNYLEKLYGKNIKQILHQ